jgi:hypothetical protein
MAAKGVSKRLVIDASVARSAGGEEATYPTSVYCRDFLKAVLDICHKVVMTPDIREEWNKHESDFARAWRRRMVAKRKFEFLDIPVNDELWNKIDRIAGTDKQRTEMFKDLLLIEAAIATDRIVISLDDIATAKTVRTHSVRHPQWHLVNNQTDPVFCGFDSSTKTSIAQSC